MPEVKTICMSIPSAFATAPTMPRRLRRRQQMCFGARCGNQFDGAAIETGEYRSAEPASFEGDHAIREISACFEDCEPSLDRWPVELHIGAVSKISYRCGDLADAAAIAAQEQRD